MSFASWVLFVGGALYVAIGLAFMAAPATLTSAVGLSLGGVTADNDVRAVYGGANLGLGAFFWLAGSRPAWGRPALFAMALALAGMAGARVLSWLVVGLPEPIAYVLHATEVAGVVLAALAIRWLPE